MSDGEASAAVARLTARAGATSFAQAARFAELIARTRGTGAARVGHDVSPREEPAHFTASDRMAMPTGDVAAIEAEPDGRLAITANVLGLAGTTPALPAYYSEVQLQRRRLRDRSMAAFYNLFDHRLLSFFWRIKAKYHWLLGTEQTGPGTADKITDSLIDFAGLATPATRDRLAFGDLQLAPLAGQLGGVRRSAASVQAILRRISGLPLRVVEGEPRWMTLAADEQTRIGHPATAQFGRLGGEMMLGGADAPDAAMIGASVLDVQHHYAVEIGPLPFDRLLDIATGGAMLALLADACRIATGIAYRPLLRLTVQRDAMPAMRLGSREAPFCLGRSSWLGDTGGREAVLADCEIAIPMTA